MKVAEFMVVERYSHVQHIVSLIRGQLAEGKTGFDALRALFPGGTITGCYNGNINLAVGDKGMLVYSSALGWVGYVTL